MRMSFSHFANLGQLAALIYYDWTARPGAKDTFGVFRCGALTDAGKLALNPWSPAVSQGAPAQANDALNSPSSGASDVASHPSSLRDVIVGVNTVGIDRMTEQQQDAFVEQLRQNGVNTVRLGMDEKFAHFITRAYQRNIGTVAVVYPWLGSEKIARIRPSAPSVGLIWGQAAFSTIDPQAFRAWFSTRLDALEASGVQLTAFEFGNEVNSAGYNGDFPIQATGRELV